MADLTTLIRLQKHELDQKRLALAGLYTAMTQLERQQRDLEVSFEREKAAVAATGDIHFTFASYVEKVKQERKKLAEQAAELEQQIAEAKNAMMEIFSELKKYEMTQAERERLAAEEVQMKESRELDEIGLETFRRRGEE